MKSGIIFMLIAGMAGIGEAGGPKPAPGEAAHRVRIRIVTRHRPPAGRIGFSVQKTGFMELRRKDASGGTKITVSLPEAGAHREMTGHPAVLRDKAGSVAVTVTDGA